MTLCQPQKQQCVFFKIVKVTNFKKAIKCQEHEFVSAVIITSNNKSELYVDFSILSQLEINISLNTG